jgi:hypothetical protein
MCWSSELSFLAVSKSLSTKMNRYHWFAVKELSNYGKRPEREAHHIPPSFPTYLQGVVLGHRITLTCSFISLDTR